jgi:hypothetical protein
MLRIINIPFIMSVIMLHIVNITPLLSVIMLNVNVLNVVAPILKVIYSYLFIFCFFASASRQAPRHSV